MGNTYPGRNMWVALGIQSAMSTVATTYDFYQPTDIGGFLEEFAMIESGRRLGTRFVGADYIGTKQVPFNFTVEVNADNFGRILKAALGADSILSATSVAHNHTFRFNNETLPYITVLASLAGVADISGTEKEVRLTGGKISKMTIAGGVDNVMTAAIEGIAMILSAATAMTTAFSTEYPFFLNSGQGVGDISLGSTITILTSFTEVRDFEIVIDNGIAPDHRIHGSSTPLGMSEGGSSITGKMTAVFNYDTFAEINNFAQGNARAVELQAALPTSMAGPAGQSKTLTIGLHRIKYSGDAPSYDPDVITIELPYKAEAGTSTYIDIKNDKSVAYSASA